MPIHTDYSWNTTQHFPRKTNHARGVQHLLNKTNQGATGNLTVTFLPSIGSIWHVLFFLEPPPSWAMNLLGKV